MADVTPDEADDAMARLDCMDVAYMVADHARRSDVDPVWRAAVERANARFGGVGAKSGRDSHRRGRRG
jgi:hypothetical protein